MREAFRELLSGWSMEDVEELAERVDRIGAFKRQHGPLEEDEERAVATLIRSLVLQSIYRGDFEPYIDRDDVETVAGWLSKSDASQ